MSSSLEGNSPQYRWVLGSRSPRRRELLSHLVPPDQIEILPPSSTDEAGFDGLRDWSAIERQLREITRAKSENVIRQLNSRSPCCAKLVVLSADTTVVARSEADELIALGQPPEGEAGRAVVADWFRRYYFGREHWVATSVRVVVNGAEVRERVVRSTVWFSADGEAFLDWYLSTGESAGKAGGYALQGAGSLFISRVEGSLSNVVGLPIRETLEMARELNLPVGSV